ncbi:MAG: septum formation initiator family protein [Kiritimatiellia bacterium]
MTFWDMVTKITWAILIGLLIVVGISMFIPRIREYHEYQRTAARLAEETRHEEEMIKHLKMQQERFQTDPRFVEYIAHEMGMAKTNETIFTFIDDLPPAGSAQ